jgi:RES domain-containing protein
VSLIYSSESRALAIAEFLVNVPVSLVPSKLSIATIKIPDDITPKDIRVARLPKNWRDYPAPIKLMDMGTHWVMSKESLLMRIPSAVVEEEFNILINPSHPEMKRLTITNIRDSKLGERFAQKAKGSL